jgi:hypothetical protein
MLSRLRVFAQPFGGMDCQFAEAYWLWSTEQECEGTLRVLNDGEKSFDDYCDAQDERLQQGRN